MGIPSLVRSAGIRRRVAASISPLATLATLHFDAQLCSFPYHQDLSQLPSSVQLEPYLALNLTQRLSKKGVFLQCTGVGQGVITSSSGLTAYIAFGMGAYNLILGGTTSGAAAGGLNKRCLLNVGQTVAQWGANFKNGLGGVPLCYEESVALLGALIDARPGMKVKVVGHSLGGAMATYAAAMCGEPGKPIDARGFCSAELGKKAISNIQQCRTEADVKALVAGIQHVFIEGDPVSRIGRLVPGLSHLGSINTINAAPGIVNPVSIHDQFMKSVEYYVKS